jgi:ABC-2 type transport system ATP-binding protein
VAEMIDLCGLPRNRIKKLKLSKGYRQRVGLAQALIHDPAVLILDEPTSGLDPNQLVEIRKLIKEISRNKTVIFSTHIMQEVSALCDRVIVINKGEIVSDSSLANLLSLQNNETVIIVEFDGYDNDVELKSTAGCGETIERVEKSSQFKIGGATAGVDLRPEIFRFAADHNLSLLGLKQEESSLGTYFQRA